MKTEIIHLPNDNQVAVYSEDDVQEHVDACHELQGGVQRSDWGRHVASIPPIMIVKALNEAWQRGWNCKWTDKDFFESVIMHNLKSGEWSKFRTG